MFYSNPCQNVLDTTPCEQVTQERQWFSLCTLDFLTTMILLKYCSNLLFITHFLFIYRKFNFENKVTPCFTGKHCESKIPFCKGIYHYCQNGAKCINIEYDYR
jgi:hypothetical protein